MYQLENVSLSEVMATMFPDNAISKNLHTELLDASASEVRILFIHQFNRLTPSMLLSEMVALSLVYMLSSSTIF